MTEPITPRIYHSVPSFALRGKPLTLTAVMRSEQEGKPYPALGISVEGARADVIPMEASETTVLKGGRFVSFSARIPEELLGNAYDLSYTLRADGKCLGRYTVPFVEREAMPPLAITEIFGRPKSDTGITYLEVMNPSDRETDLYDYKLICCTGVEPVDPEKPCEITLSDTPGTVLLPGEVAVLRFISPALHNAGDPVLLSDEAFFAGLRAVYPYADYPVDFSKVRVIPLEFGVYNPEKDKYVTKAGKFDLPAEVRKNPHTLILTPRDGKAADALYTLTYGEESFNWDTPVRRSSMWTVDIEHPKVAKRLSAAELPTPGVLAYGQAVPDFDDDEAPVIIPLSTKAYYLADGDMTMSFAVLDRCVTSATLFVKGEAGVFRAFRAHRAAEEDVFEATVPYTFFSGLDRFEYYITASDSLRQASLGSSENCLNRTLYDNDGPSILSVTPKNGYAVENDFCPRIRIAYYDRAGVDVQNGKLKLDGKNVTGKAKWYSDAVVYEPEKPLSMGEHRIDIQLCDLLGNKSSFRSFFSLTDGETMNCYRGEVHCHTMESDGSGFPEQAMMYARDVGKADFFSVTEHSHYLPDEAYRRQVEVADLFNDPGHFAALYGWEMTWNYNNGYWGHMNVLGTKDIVHDIDSVTMPQLFEFIKGHPEAVAMFNHPGLAWGNFDDYNFHSPEIDKQICLSEIKGPAYDFEYALSLSKGWHVAPVFNEDNHAPNWTTAGPSIGYVLAPALTRENIMDAFRRRRTYSTSDPTLKLRYRVNGKWLGSTLKDPEKLDISVSLETENEAGIGKIQIVGEDNIVVAELDVGVLRSYTWELTLPPLYDYYYVRITGKGIYTVSAPVWIEGRKPLAIEHIRVFHSHSEKRPNAVSLRILNREEKALRNLCVNFYLTDLSGFPEEITKPYETVYLDKVAAGESVVVSRLFPNLKNHRRVTAIVRAESGVDRTVCQATSYVVLSPLQITAVVPNTAKILQEDGTEVANPFAYIQLYNNANTELDLSTAQLRLWTKTGKAPFEDSILPLSGVKILPESPYVIWRRPKGSTLTVSDFNAHYNTHLIEGVNLLVTDRHVISAQKSMRRIDVIQNGDTLARVNYNYALDAGKDTNEGSVLLYRYTPNLSGTAEKLTNTGLAAPELVTAEQKARDFVLYEKKAEKKGEKNALKRQKKREADAKAPKMKRSVAIAIAAGAAALSAAATAAVTKALKK